MAAVGEASAVAGLVGLAGQTIKAVTTLAKFVRDIKNAHRDVQAVCDELEILTKLLNYTQKEAPAALTPDKCPPALRTQLANCLSMCTDDVVKWTSWMGQFHQSTGISKVLKKVRAAAEKSEFNLIGQRISYYVDKIVLCFQLLQLDLGSRFLEWHSRHDSNLERNQRLQQQNYTDVVTKLDQVLSITEDTKISFSKDKALLFHRLDSIQQGNTDLHSMAVRHYSALESLQAEFRAEFAQLRDQVNDYKNVYHYGHNGPINHLTLPKSTATPEIALQMINTPTMIAYMDLRIDITRLRALHRIQRQPGAGSYRLSSRSSYQSSPNDSCQIFLAKSTFDEKVMLLSFVIDVFRFLQAQDTPVLWALNQRKGAPIAAVQNVSSIFRSFALQSATIAAGRMVNQNLTALSAITDERANLDSFIGHLADILAELPGVWIVLDLELLSSDEDHALLIRTLKRLVEEVNRRKHKTVIRVLLLTSRIKSWSRMTEATSRGLTHPTYTLTVSGDDSCSSQSKRLLTSEQGPGSKYRRSLCFLQEQPVRSLR